MSEGDLSQGKTARVGVRLHLKRATERRSIMIIAGEFPQAALDAMQGHVCATQKKERSSVRFWSRVSGCRDSAKDKREWEQLINECGGGPHDPSRESLEVLRRRINMELRESS